MLGNFSFGDYFKKDAIAWAWELVTGTLGLPVDKLAVTVFRDDDEAEQLWLQTGVRKERIFRLGEKDNFWAMGPTGPCGPCSEIHLFRVPGEHSIAAIDEHADKFFRQNAIADSDSWMEIWNLVFMQFERKEADGPLLPLPKPSIDTGAGLERVAAAVQEVHSNYDTDLLQPLIQEAARISGKTYSVKDYGPGDSTSMRVVADHARAGSFLIADGVLPSNEGRGYVLRRILRRAIRHAQRLAKEPALFAKICARVIDTMAEAYPELRESRVRILETIQHETDAFLRTLDRGSAILAEEIGRNPQGKTISGELAFQLYDTYGFPLDLTQVIAAESGFSVDVPGFEKLMEAQRARSTFAGSGEAAVGDVYKALAAELPENEFLGYQKEVVAHGTLLAALVAGHRVHRIVAGEKAELVFDRTPFYGESGGQLGDQGLVVGPGGRAQVLDAQKPVQGLIVHSVKLLEGALAVGDKVELVIDADRRRGLRSNHSATHLLHRALRELLGEGVKQAGSVVAPDYLRFDYTAYQPLTDEQRQQLEERVNQLVRENHLADTKVMSPDDAMRSGAIAFFGDKYNQLSAVRVLQIGPSMELCGGTHVSRSGDIGFFKLVSDSAIASGVRRIVAMTGPEAVAMVHDEEKQLARAAALLKGSPKDVAIKAEALLSRLKDLERELDALQKKAAAAKSSELAQGAREVKGVRVLAARHESGDPEALRELADKLRDQLKSGIVVLGGVKDDKATLLVAVTSDLSKRYRAGDLVKELSKIMGGRGGGKPELAQAGGGDPAQLDAALARAYEIL
jgi:alanyl-tRNA synthetase